MPWKQKPCTTAYDDEDNDDDDNDDDDMMMMIFGGFLLHRFVCAFASHRASGIRHSLRTFRHSWCARISVYAHMCLCLFANESIAQRNVVPCLSFDLLTTL